MSFLPDWDFGLLEELIEARGDKVILETGVACSCRREDVVASTLLKDNQPATRKRFNCQECQGDGYIYRNARCIRGLLTSVQAGPNRKLIEAGYAVPGDAVFSPSSCAGPIDDFDRITMTYPDSVGDGQIIMRNAAHISHNQGMRTGVAEDEDRLWYMADTAVWCEDDNRVIYDQGADFVFDGRVIRWVGKKPDDGTFYTIKYRALLEWIVYNTPLLRIDHGRTLGQRVLIRKKHVAFHNGSQALTPAERQEEQNILTTRVKI